MRLNARSMTNKMPIFVRSVTYEVNAFQSHVYVCRYNLSCLSVCWFCLLASFAHSLFLLFARSVQSFWSEIVKAGFFSALTFFCVTFDWIVLLLLANRLWNKIMSRLCTQRNGVNQPHIIYYLYCYFGKYNFVNQFSISKRDFRSYWNVTVCCCCCCCGRSKNIERNANDMQMLKLNCFQWQNAKSTRLSERASVCDTTHLHELSIFWLTLHRFAFCCFRWFVCFVFFFSIHFIYLFRKGTHTYMYLHMCVFAFAPSLCQICWLYSVAFLCYWIFINVDVARKAYAKNSSIYKVNYSPWVHENGNVQMGG